MWCFFLHRGHRVTVKQHGHYQRERTIRLASETYMWVSPFVKLPPMSLLFDFQYTRCVTETSDLSPHLRNWNLCGKRHGKRCVLLLWLAFFCHAPCRLKKVPVHCAWIGQLPWACETVYMTVFACLFFLVLSTALSRRSPRAIFAMRLSRNKCVMFSTPSKRSVRHPCSFPSQFFRPFIVLVFFSLFARVLDLGRPNSRTLKKWLSIVFVHSCAISFHNLQRKLCFVLTLHD